MIEIGPQLAETIQSAGTWIGLIAMLYVIGRWS